MAPVASRASIAAAFLARLESGPNGPRTRSPPYSRDSARSAGLERTRHFASKAEATAALREELRDGDVLLVKGSRALELETVVQLLSEEGNGP